MKNLFTLFLFVSFYTHSQHSAFKIPDSLQKKGFPYLEDRINELKKDSTKVAIYLNSYLKKAKLEKNWRELQNGYQNLLHHSPSKMRLVYADSMLYAAKKTKDSAAIGSAFLTKGIVFYAQKEHKAALDEYLKANTYIAKTNDMYLVSKVKYNIAQIKNYMGLYDEAISLLRQCVSYYKKNHSRPYLNSLHSLGLSYNKAGNYGMCSQTNAVGLKESAIRNIPEMNTYFRQSEGVNQYFLKNYGQAITQLKDVVDELKDIEDFANEAVANFYIGKSYWDLNFQQSAIPYFSKVDEILNYKQFTRMDFLETYKLLIDYFKAKDDPKSQLYYVDQLLKATHLLAETNQYLSSKVHKEYDSKTYLIEKQKIEKQLERRKNNDIIFIAILTLLLLTLIPLSIKHYKIKSIRKKNPETLMSKTVEQKKRLFKIRNIDKPDINSISAAQLVNQLDKWEQDQKFLGHDITLVKLAATFETNTKYLSLIINHYRHKKFIPYINDLKIDYLIKALAENKRLQHYTHKAMAEEIGFSTTQRFSQAFLARAKVPTSDFIAHLEKKEAKNIQ